MRESRLPVTPWLVRAYLRSPIRPLRRADARRRGEGLTRARRQDRQRRVSRLQRGAVHPAGDRGLPDPAMWSTRSWSSTTTRAIAPRPKRPRRARGWSPRRGRDTALRFGAGWREARGDIIILAEPDGTFIGRDVLKLLAYADDFDMVCGTRTTRELIWDQANMGWFLRVGNCRRRQAAAGAPRRAVAERLRLHAAPDASRRGRADSRRADRRRLALPAGDGHPRARASASR